MPISFVNIFQTPLIPSNWVSVAAAGFKHCLPAVPRMPSEPRFQTPLRNVPFKHPLVVSDSAAVPPIPSRYYWFRQGTIDTVGVDNTQLGIATPYK